MSSTTTGAVKQGGNHSSSEQKRKRKGAPKSDEEDSSPSDDQICSDDNVTQRPDPANTPKIINGITEFMIDPVAKHFTCPICNGLFRDPVTITECLHSFCMSCVCNHFRSITHCPTCDYDLGPNPYQFILPDRTLENLSDKILFTRAKKKDDEAEAAFYKERGIRRKLKVAGKDDEHDERDSIRAAKAFDEVEFFLIPNDHVNE